MANKAVIDCGVDGTAGEYVSVTPDELQLIAERDQRAAQDAATSSARQQAIAAIHDLAKARGADDQLVQALATLFPLPAEDAEVGLAEPQP